MNWIVGIGGTGQMVLHYYLQLYLLGIIKEPFKAIVIDTDDILPSIKLLQVFFENLQYGAKGVTLGGSYPQIDLIKVPLPEGNVFRVLTGREMTSDKTSPHPVQAFFSENALRQDTGKGLYAMPALSSTISRDEIFNHPSLKYPPDKVLICGSVIGGTGGGLIAPVANAIKKNKESGTIQIRAVLFKEYFKADEHLINRGRLLSNQELILRSLEDSDLFHSYCLIEGNREYLEERNTQVEKKAQNISWQTSHPYWDGVKALKYLTGDNVKPKGSKFDEESIPINVVKKDTDSINDNYAINKRDKTLQMLKCMVDNEVLIRMKAEPFVNRVWGKGLTTMVSHFWSIAKEQEPNNSANFPEKLQDQLRRWWKGEGDKRGLESVFPHPASSPRISPSDFRIGITWPSDKKNLDKNQFKGGIDTIASKSASIILYWALRGTKEGG